MDKELRRAKIESFFANPIFNGNAKISDKMDSISFELYNDSLLTPSFIGNAMVLINKNKRELCDLLPKGVETMITISGWDVDGLVESNFGLIDDSSEFHFDGNEITVAMSMGDVYKGVETWIGDDIELVVGGNGYDIYLSEGLMSDYVDRDHGQNGTFRFDSFIEDVLPDFADKKGLYVALGNLIIEDVYSSKYADKLSIEKDFSLFDIARFGKDEIYNIIQEAFEREGVKIEISDMTATPVKMSGDEVAYLFTPTSYKILNQDSPLFDDKDDNISLGASRP